MHSIVERLQEICFRNVFTCMYYVCCILHHKCISLTSYLVAGKRLITLAWFSGRATQVSPCSWKESMLTGAEAFLVCCF